MAQLERAHRRIENDYGDPFYRVATALVRLSKRRQNRVKVADALAALLLTWNASFYTRNPGPRRRLVRDLDGLLGKHRRALARLSGASIKSLRTHEEDARSVFAAFDEKLGPVGAAKALHLLAPRFFPLWDRAIAKAYLGGGMQKAGKNVDRYLRFMELVQGQYESLPDARTLGRYQLRALDEFNYCRYTKKWRV